MGTTQGIHHVTAITGALDRHLDFYTRVLGLRLVKRTVNFDDPGSYHLYYGDAAGSPGSILTFFVWPAGGAGRVGTGVTGAVALAVPPTSMGFWYERLLSHGIAAGPPARRFDEPVLELADPDGMRVELIGSSATGAPAGWDGPIPAEHAIRGLHGVTIWENGDDGHAATLEEVFGLRPAGEEENRLRFRGTGDLGAVIDLRRVGGFWRGLGGPGVVHHVAFRAGSDAAQAELRAAAAASGLHPTGVLDRQYFRSVYFRQPHGVLFEVATDDPGFLVDETAEALGAELRLPPWLETSRAGIEANLPPLHALHLPGVA
jgi:glyoxalase family protein